ncbi:MAG: hypothetical protein AAFR81_24435 [Chloroflexota bacterium]
MLRTLLFAVLMFVLVACGNAETDTPADAESSDDTAVTTTENDTDTDTEESTDDMDADAPLLTLSVTGNETFEFEAENLTFGCVEDEFTVTTPTASPNVSIYLPSSIEAGTYPLADFDPNVETSYVEGSAVVAIRGEFVAGSGSAFGTSYFVNNAGELVIENVPAEPGGRFTATLDGTFETPDGESITAIATIDLETSSMFFLDCEF